MEKKQRVQQDTLMKARELMVKVTDLYTPSGLAKKLGISRQSVYNKIKMGEIPAHSVYEIQDATLILHS